LIEFFFHIRLVGITPFTTMREHALIWNTNARQYNTQMHNIPMCQLNACN